MVEETKVSFTMTQEIKASIIVPFFNRWDLTHARLAEFRQFLPPYCEIILVDDCSTDNDTRSGIAFWQKSGIALHPIKYIRNNENLGFTKSVNRGCKAASGEYVIFYSNDVIMHGNVIDITLELLSTHEKAIVGGRSVYWDSGWNKFNLDGKDVIVPYLEGYYLACKKSNLEELGGFDEQYAPYDYEDVDLSLNAFLLGYNLLALNTRLLQHLSGQTAQINPNREEITKRNRVKFIEKWQGRLREL